MGWVKGGQGWGLELGLLGSYRSHLPLALQLFSGRTTWVYSINNVLMSLSGLAVAWVGGLGVRT